MVSSHEPPDPARGELASIESAVASRNPAVPATTVHTLVQQSYDRLTPAKVHNYLPILVSREVQAELKVRQLA